MNTVFQFLWICMSLTVINHAAGIAVMSVDLGSEWMKIGIVSPGVPMEIVLNKESKRKTSAVVSFRDNIRTFGEDAQAVGIKYPQNSYLYLIDLLAKDINHPIVKLYKEHFPYYNIVQDTQRGTIVFKHDENTYYSVEELIAQLLSMAKELAEQSAKQPIKECVLTVPGYFNQAERKALMQAASLANLKVLQLINDYTAVALNYGIFRIKDFNETAQYVMFIDIGSSSTQVAVVSYQTIKTKERGYVEKHPQLSVLGVGYDRTLGGRHIQIKLRDYLATEFNKLNKTSDVFKNPRAMAKLYKEAGRLKNVLSANFDHYAQIEALLDDIDFKAHVTRENLENICSDFFNRVSAPVEQALKAAGLTVDLINHVVLFGASTRIPKVQEILKGIVGQDLGKYLNTDEAAALGAVFKAAALSSAFQVTKFITKDAVVFPIQVVFERESDSAIKQVKRTLFSPMNPYPQKKIITFNKHTKDFSFNVNYAELEHLSDEEILSIGSLNLTEINLVGVPEVFNKHSGENVENKGIKAHFSLDDSGILKFVNAELVVEKTVLPEEQSEQELGTLSKLGSTISKLFAGESDPTVKESESASKDTEETSAKENKLNETESKNATTTQVPKENKPKIITYKEPINGLEKVLHIDQLNKEQFEESFKKLDELNAIDREINRRANALNSLESFVIEAQNKLDETEYAQMATPEEIEKIKAACSAISEWLYEDGSDADAETYESKLNELKVLTRDFYTRMFEHKERPEALSALDSMLTGSLNFLETAKNFTKGNSEKDIFTDVEVETLQKVINETEVWRNDVIDEQNKLKKSDTVVLTVRLISEKMVALDREVKYLVNKLKMWKPKKIEKPKVDENVTSKPDESELPITDEEKEADIEIEQTDEEPAVDEDQGDTIEPSKPESDSDMHTEL